MNVTISTYKNISISDVTLYTILSLIALSILRPYVDLLTLLNFPILLLPFVIIFAGKIHTPPKLFTFAIALIFIQIIFILKNDIMSYGIHRQILVPIKSAILPIFTLWFITASGKSYLKRKIKNFEIIIYIFFIVYAYKYYLLKIPRPSFLYENNMELLFIGTVLSYKMVHNSNKMLLTNVIFFLIILISGSKSILLGWLLTTIILYFNTYRLKAMHIIYAFILTSAVAISATSTFIRLSNYETIDRFSFLIYSVIDFQKTEFLNKIINFKTVIADKVACESLDFYSTFFVIGGSNICTVSIYHSWFLVSLNSMGIITMFLTIKCFYYYYRRILHTSIHGTIVCLVLPLISSLSVSGFSNVFYLLGICFISMERENVTR